MVKVSVVHQNVPGRIRMRVRELYRSEGMASWIKAQSRDISGLVDVSVQPLTGGILVYFDRKQIAPKKIQSLISKWVTEGLEAKGAHPKKGEDSGVCQKDKNWAEIPVSRVLREFSSSAQSGLTFQNAERHLRIYGKNHLPLPSHKSDLDLILAQLNNLPTLLLLGSSMISLLTGGLTEALAILSVIGMNSYIGFLTESSAEKTIGSLMSSKQGKARVIREGREWEVPASEVALGDLIVLAPGCTVVADARILHARHLSVDESLLTGESLPVLKSSQLLKGERHLADQSNRVFRGTWVTGGNGVAVVTATGPFTEVGKIQILAGESMAPETPLQIQLRKLGAQMAMTSIFFSGAILAVALLRGHSLRDMLKMVVSLATAAIPESLPTIATTTLARGIKNLHEHGVLVRHLNAVETLSNIDLICLDKTGTLTLNQMTVTRVSTSSFDVRVNPINPALKGRVREAWDGACTPSFGPEGTFDPLRYRELKRLFEVITLCNEATPELEKGVTRMTGSSTECALVQSAMATGIDPKRLRSRYPRLQVHYRTESRGYMVSFHSYPKDRVWVAVKGAPDQVLDRCTLYLQNNKILTLDETTRAKFRTKNEEMAMGGLRVLGVAYRISTEPLSAQEGDFNNSDLIWLGLVAMEDPIRTGMKETVANLHRFGIETVMVTGDQQATALSIGRELGVSQVFPRVSPASKLEIVRALQRSGKVVAMIGDGINDGPALKIADVGIAMGGKGAEVTTRVADMVLRNDDVGKIVVALKESQRIHQDIHKAVSYILTQNLSEILFTFFSVALGMGKPLSTFQYLWMNLVTDIFPELALAQDPLEKTSEPRNLGLRTATTAESAQGFLSETRMSKILLDALALSVPSLLGYSYGRQKYHDHPSSRTIGFMSLITSGLFYALCCRSERITVFDRTRPPENPYIQSSILLGLLMEAIAVYQPKFKQLLEIGNIEGWDYGVVGLASLLPVVLVEFEKESAKLSGGVRA